MLQNALPRNTSARRQNALEDALSGITRAIEHDLFAGEVSRRAGLFQSLDPRVKLISVLSLLVSVSLSRSLLVIVAIYGLAILFAWLSAVPTDFLLKRVWLALPFFTGLIVLPALFVTPGPALLYLPLGLVITRTGAVSGLFLLLRVSTSVSLTLLLILTTPWNTLLSALAILRVPDVFVLILGMTYRYIYLLLHSANDMFLSRKSRVVGRLSAADNQRMLAAIGGTLLVKSINLSNEVFLAMQSRGFRGTMISPKPFKMHPRDWIWLFSLEATVVASILLGR